MLAAVNDAARNTGPRDTLVIFYAGHGIGNTRKQQLLERADIYSFFLWQMGVDGYQPKAP